MDAAARHGHLMATAPRVLIRGSLLKVTVGTVSPLGQPVAGQGMATGISDWMLPGVSASARTKRASGPGRTQAEQFE